MFILFGMLACIVSWLEFASQYYIGYIADIKNTFKPNDHEVSIWFIEKYERTRL